MADDQTKSAPGEPSPTNGGEGAPLPVRRSGRVRKRPSDHSEDVEDQAGPSTTSPASADTRRNPKRRATPEAFDLPDNILEASLGPWKENEQAEWASWIEVESDPALFTAILGSLGVKGARIEEVLSVDEDSLAALPSPVYGLVFLYEYVAEESAEVSETSKDVWFANQTTQNACATIALLNIIMNAKGLKLGDKLSNFKRESWDLSPPLRGDMINNSAWIRMAHNSFARRLDLLNAALVLQNEVDEKKKRARSSASKQKKKKLKREKSSSKSSDTSAYHFIAYVPVGQRVWQLDGLTSTPVCIGEYQKDQHWTSVMRPVLQERMMRYETERLSFSLLALCSDSSLAETRQKLAANIRALADLEARFGTHPDWHDQTNRFIIYDLTHKARLASYQLDAEDIFQAAAIPEIESKSEMQTEGETKHPNPPNPDPNNPQSQTFNAAVAHWADLCAKQKHLRAEYFAREMGMDMRGGDQQQQPTPAILGRTKDYTAAVHEWVKKLAERGVLRGLHEEVQVVNGL